MKPVNTDLHGAVAFHMVDLQRPRDELAGHFATDIVFYALGQFLFAERHTALVVIELHIVSQKRS